MILSIPDTIKALRTLPPENQVRIAASIHESVIIVGWTSRPMRALITADENYRLQLPTDNDNAFKVFTGHPYTLSNQTVSIASFKAVIISRTMEPNQLCHFHTSAKILTGLGQGECPKRDSAPQVQIGRYGQTKVCPGGILLQISYSKDWRLEDCRPQGSVGPT